MKIRFLNLLLIGSIVLSVMLSSCKKDDDNSNTNGGTDETTGNFTDSRDNKVYKWVKIGEQVWMAENLAYTGSDMQHITVDFDEWTNNRIMMGGVTIKSTKIMEQPTVSYISGKQQKLRAQRVGIYQQI